MSKYFYLLGIIFLILHSNIALHAKPEQGFYIEQRVDTYRVVTDITEEVVFTSLSASMSIQWAIDNISNEGLPGGEVHIKTGSYPLDNYVILRDNIWLHGDGPTTELYINSQLIQAILIQDAKMAMVSDLSLTNRSKQAKPPRGIIMERSINCQVINVDISGFGIGILNNLESSLILFNSNNLTDNSTQVLIHTGGGVIARWLPILITNNTIEGGDVGISCDAMVTHILDNKIMNTSKSAIVASANSIVVRGNHIENAGGDFAIYGNGAEFNCTKNFIHNSGGGIRTRTRWGTFSNNTIENSGSDTTKSIGILIVSDDANEGPAESKVVYNNTIRNDGDITKLKYGIKEAGLNSVIAKNKIKNAEYSILSEGKETIVKENVE